jgi:drug/metabolite transporter (DMT)-like permease
MWAIGAVIGKKILNNVPPLLFTAIALLLSGLILIPSFFFYNFQKNIKPLLTGTNIILLVIYCLVWLVLGELIFNAGLSKLSPIVATLLTFTLPLFTALISVVFLGEKITWQLVLGAVLIFSGVVVLAK